jgi:hypothetical protein
MRRRRRLVQLFPVVSLLACVATAVLWARTSGSTDCLTLASRNLFQVASGGGGLCVQELSLVRREDDWTAGTGRAGRPPRLVQYKESPADLSEWARRTGRPVGQVAWDARAAGDWLTLVGGPVAPGRTPGLPSLVPLSLLQLTTDSMRERPVNGVFQAERKVREELLVGHRVWVPYWPIVAITGWWPALRFLAWLRRSRRMRSHLCPVCGYDLRASPERCPECGAVPGAKGAA